MIVGEKILTQEQIDYFFNLPEVTDAKWKIDDDSAGKGSVYFSVIISDEIRQFLSEKLSVKIGDSIPMRWIKGDTHPHVDTGVSEFQKTHLVYLTDSPGHLLLDGNSFPIEKGAAFVFPEGLPHETIGTGNEPRLLLGPMSEQCVAVGFGPSIFADGATDVVYIREYAGVVQYKINNGDWFSVYFPSNVINTADNKSTDILKVIFTTDFDVINSDMYFVCASDGIQFGDTSLKEDGSRPTIGIVGIENYPGLIQNGNDFSSGYNYIRILNLNVNVYSSFLAETGGWIAQKHFGVDAIENYIINCSSNGEIGPNSGGITGAYTGLGGGARTRVRNGSPPIKIIGCSTSGTIGQNSGGIVGMTCANVQCESCWSTGFIDENGGGIIGKNPQGNTTVLHCYSTGNIGNYAGGIVGSDCSGPITISTCYATGNIASSAGGILGGNAQGAYAVIINCYSIGTISADAGGIYGSPNIYPGGNITVQNCYTVGAVTGDPVGYIIGGSADYPSDCYSEAKEGTPGNWTAINANQHLLGTPNTVVGTGWTETNMDQPWELTNMGYTPFTTNNITSEPALNRIWTFNVAKGASTPGGIGLDRSYRILQKSGADPVSYDTINIDDFTGVISTTSNTNIGTYGLYIRNVGSYNITEVELNVYSNGPIPCLTEETMVLTPNGYRNVADLRQGDFVNTGDRRAVKIIRIHRTIVQGNENTFPCVIPKDSIAPGYPPQHVRVSQDHLIRHRNGWILPKKHFALDKKDAIIRYYHIELPNYVTDHLVVNGGTIVESYSKSTIIDKQAKYNAERKKRIAPGENAGPQRTFSIR